MFFFFLFFFFFSLRFSFFWIFSKFLFPDTVLISRKNYSRYTDNTVCQARATAVGGAFVVYGYVYKWNIVNQPSLTFFCCSCFFFLVFFLPFTGAQCSDWQAARVYAGQAHADRCTAVTAANERRRRVAPGDPAAPPAARTRGTTGITVAAGAAAAAQHRERVVTDGPRMNHDT